MQYGNLIVILAPMGGGKTTLLRQLLKKVKSPVLAVDPGNEIQIAGPEYFDGCWRPDAQDRIARRFADYPEFSWLVLDDADSFLTARSGQTSWLMLELSHLKQLRANAILTSKTPGRMPDFLKSGATHLCYQRFNSPASDGWIIDAGHEVIDLPPRTFRMFDRYARKYRTISLDSDL